MPVGGELLQRVTPWLEQTRWRLDILAEDLLPGLLDQPEILHLLQQLAIRGRHSRIRLLNRNTELVARNGHRLIPLIQRLPSVIHARLSEPDRCAQPWWLMLADGQHLLLQQDEDGLPRQVSGREAELWQERFNECWEHAREDPYLRRVHL